MDEGEHYSSIPSPGNEDEKMVIEHCVTEGGPSDVSQDDLAELPCITSCEANPSPVFLVDESGTNYQCGQENSGSTVICLDKSAVQSNEVNCLTRECSPDLQSTITKATSYDTPEKKDFERDEAGEHKRAMLMDVDPHTVCLEEGCNPNLLSESVHKPKYQSVEIQVSMGPNDFQDFKFTCDWERPQHDQCNIAYRLGNRNAIVQCNIAKGMCIGVPKVNLIVPSSTSTKCPLKPAATVLHRKPVPIVVKDKNKQYARNKFENLLFSRSIGIQCYITPKRGYTVASKSTQACLAMSSNNNLSFMKKTIEKQDAGCVSSRLPLVQLPDSITITKITPQNDKEVGSKNSLPVPEVNVSTVHCTHKGFRGYDSIEESTTQAADFKGLCGFGINIFQILLSKLDISGNITPLMSNKSLLLLFLMKLNLGISSSALGVLFGLNGTITLDLFITTLRTLRTRTRNVLYMPSLETISNELPPYFQGVYMKARIILVCAEFVAKEPTTEADKVKMWSDRGTYSFRAVVAMTPLGKVCFKSKPYRGQTSFETIMKECNIVGYLRSGDVVLAESLLSEMQIVLQKGVLVVVPGSTQVKAEDGPRTRKSHHSNEDLYGAEVKRHIERCARRLTSVKLMREIPCSLFPYVTELLHVWYSIINHMPSILRYDQPE